jgi:uncharacterized OsmC-like protein
MHRASVHNEGDRQYRASTKGGDFLMGEGGVGPIDALLASLCACVAHHLRDHLAQQGGTCPRLTVTADAGLAPDKLALATIAVRVEVAGRSLSDAQQADLLRQAGRCPIYNTLKQCADVSLGIV